MIVAKDLRIDILGESLFEGVNFVIASNERVALMGPNALAVRLCMRVLSGDEDMDEGKVLADGECISYITAENLQATPDALNVLMRTRPTFLFVDTTDMNDAQVREVTQMLKEYRGGVLVASDSSYLMREARIARVLEIRDFAKTITSFTGTYEAYLTEREKDLARITEAYDRQQREKQKLENWLEQKRDAAAKNRSPQNGNTIRTKKKYLEREILSKEIPNPRARTESDEVEE